MPTVHASPARVHSARKAAAARPAAPDGPARADDRWHAAQSTDHHFDGPTPDEVLDGPEPDWDGMADESAALDRLCAGCLL